MKRFFALVAALTIAFGAFGTVRQAEAQIEQADPAFSNTRIGTFGVPTLTAAGDASGFTFSTMEAAAGPLHVVLTGVPGVAVYLDFMQMPTGLDAETATQQALSMARDDVPAEGWIYGGGSFTFGETPVEFIVDLTPGTWQLAASYQPDGGEEIMTLTPFTVRDATPAASPAIEADVTLELQDVAFGLSPESVSAGPHIWHVTNTGEQPRQMVLFRTPRPFTSADFMTFFDQMNAGTPPADFFSMVWVGYTAVASSGYGTYVELDLEPGIYTATSWVIDPDTQMPALLLGMVQSFEVS